MTTTDPTIPFTDRRWREPSDRASPWRAGYRLLQGWYRVERLGIDQAGEVSDRTQEVSAAAAPKPARYAVSMLPVSVVAQRPAANFFDDLAVLKVVDDRLLQADWGGITDEDRWRRNLLTSQALCANLFGAFWAHGLQRPLQRWLESLGADVDEVLDVRIEWAPPRRKALGTGSAFDAFVIWSRRAGGRGFAAIETKYAEDMTESPIPKVRPVVRAYVDDANWRPGAWLRLANPLSGQIFLNTALANWVLTHGSTIDEPFVEGFSIGISPAHDIDLRDATIAVAAETANAAIQTRWSPIEEVLSHCTPDSGAAELAGLLTERYLDLAPVAQYLAPGDARLSPPQVFDTDSGWQRLTAAYHQTQAYAERVLSTGAGDDSSWIAHELALHSATRPEPLHAAASLLERAGEDLRAARVQLAPSDDDTQAP
jgi:hypothetical protein